MEKLAVCVQDYSKLLTFIDNFQYSWADEYTRTAFTFDLVGDDVLMPVGLLLVVTGRSG